MSTIDVGLRLGDAIDPFHLANGFEAVIGYECQERSNPPFSHSYDAYSLVCHVTVCVFITAGPITKLFAGGGGGDGTREEPGTFTQGAPVFPGSSRLGIEPKLQGGWCKTQPPGR